MFNPFRRKPKYRVLRKEGKYFPQKVDPWTSEWKYLYNFGKDHKENQYKWYRDYEELCVPEASRFVVYFYTVTAAQNQLEFFMEDIFPAVPYDECCF